MSVHKNHSYVKCRLPRSIAVKNKSAFKRSANSSFYLKKYVHYVYIKNITVNSKTPNTHDKRNFFTQNNLHIYVFMTGLLLLF